MRQASLPTLAAGLALVGKIPFHNTLAVFAVHRGSDIFRMSVAYNRANVKIIGHAAGQSRGYAGPSHHTLEDLSSLRALPNKVILCPSDAVETTQRVRWVVDYDGPVYLRLSRASVPPIHASDCCFEMGKTERLRDGRDVSVFVTGDLVTLALSLHDCLQAEGVSARVVNVPTLKPLPPAEIIKHGQDTPAAITLEDHNIFGGLGSAVAEIYAENLQKPVKRLGIPDAFTDSDDCDVLRTAYGISVENALESVRTMLRGAYTDIIFSSTETLRQDWACMQPVISIRAARASGRQTRTKEGNLGRRPSQSSDCVSPRPTPSTLSRGGQLPPSTVPRCHRQTAGLTIDTTRLPDYASKPANSH